MTEVTIATLLASGAVMCWYGWIKGHRDAERTIELHTDGIIYCFEEPRNSMAKTLKERIIIQGASVVDCGTHRGRLCFGIEVASLCCIEQLHQTGMFTSSPTAKSADPSTNARRLVILFFTGDKHFKWRFINLLRRAAQEEPSGSLIAYGDAAQEWNVDTRGTYRRLNRPPRIIDESCDEPLEGHEVEQLADVLEAYETQQRDRQSMEEESAEIPDCRLYSNEVQCRETKIEEAGEWAEPPERLLESPLFESCIAKRPANRFCADCGAPWPTWAVLRPVGAFVCIHCVGVHRQLWPQKCRELQLDRWNTDDIAFMTSRGNEIVNEELEYGGYETADALHGTVYKPIRTQSPSDMRERFIYFKYNGYFSRERHAAKQTERIPPLLDPGAVTLVAFAPNTISSVNTSDTSQGKGNPMRYIGVAYVTIKEVWGVRSKGAVVALTNGFQEVRSRPATATTLKDSGKSLTIRSRCTQWDESLHIGIHSATAPLYVALYSSADELIGVAEWALPNGSAATGEPQLMTVPLMWWNGSAKKRRVYDIFNAQRDRKCSPVNGENGTAPLVYLVVSFSRFGEAA